MGGAFHEPFIGLPFSLGTMGVYIFFVISGILVTKSFVQSKSITHFMVYRATRIFPALVVCLVICALIMGPLVTNLTLFEYVSRWQVWSFLLNNIFLYGNIQSTLPEVFISNPLPHAVNDPIWTLPWELRAYVFLAIGGLVFSIKKFWMAGGLLFVLAALNALFLMDVSKPSMFLLFFFFGSTLFLLQIKTGTALILAGILALISLVTHDTPMFEIFLCGEIAVLVFVVGFSQWGAFKIFEKYDLSYGLYIYAFPVGQLLVYIWGIGNPWVLFVLNVAVAGVLALLSWIFIEKPMLEHKRLIADRLLALFSGRVMSERK